jgi:hypothetical protein
MKTLEIQDKGNSRFKLTITPTRVTIKLAQDSSETYRDRVVKFFNQVANLPQMLNIDKSFRGVLNKKDIYFYEIVMYNDSKSEAFLFTQTDEENITCQKI